MHASNTDVSSDRLYADSYDVHGPARSRSLPNPDYYDPERYFSGDAEVKGAKNYLVFGTGPHYCLGQLYAQLNLALMIGKASVQMNWTHHATPLSEEIKVFATIFPKVRDELNEEPKIVG